MTSARRTQAAMQIIYRLIVAEIVVRIIPEGPIGPYLTPVIE